MTLFDIFLRILYTFEFASFILIFLQNKLGKAATEEDADLSNEEYVVEKILAKRLHPKKKCSEYLIKWEGYSQ